MGFAKYQEDIVSRYVNDNRDNQNIPARPTQKKFKKNNPTAKKEKSMALKQFAIQKARPLPVIILADTSGSMSENGKIGALNDAIKDMVATFADESRRMAEIHVSLVTFGGDAPKMHLSLAAAHEIKNLELMEAKGRTPMGKAFELVANLLEDKELIPSRAYRPTLVLLSDGHPTDEWQKGLRELCSSERAQKATRLAMAIGSDADESILKEFINDLEAPLFRAHQARDLHKFFRAITMSVTTRTRSQSPNDIPAIDFNDFLDEDDLELKF